MYIYHYLPLFTHSASILPAIFPSQVFGLVAEMSLVRASTWAQGPSWCTAAIVSGLWLGSCDDAPSDSESSGFRGHDTLNGYGSIAIHTIFRGMNIHKSQLFWCEQKRGIGFRPIPKYQQNMVHDSHDSHDHHDLWRPMAAGIWVKYQDSLDMLKDTMMTICASREHRSALRSFLVAL